MGKAVVQVVKSNPMDELLRARLRIPQGANLRLKALRGVMRTIDVISRTTTGQAFFSIKEAEEMLIKLEGRVGPELVEMVLGWSGGTTLTPFGIENIPTKGPVVIGSTHPIGTFDFLAHAGVLLDHRPDLKVVANRETERFLGPDRIIAVDLNRADQVLTARQTRDGMERHLGNGGAMLIFGSGRVADQKNGYLFEPPWRNGLTKMSTLTNAPIVPASANMRNSRHYYRTRRTALMLSRNNEFFAREVASLRYSSELVAKLGGSYDVHYGPAQPPGTAADIIMRLAEGLVPDLYGPKSG